MADNFIIIQGENVSPADAGSTNPSLPRTQTQNAEDAPNATGFDEYGIRPDYTGTGYLDINGTAGTKVDLDLASAVTGEYDFSAGGTYDIYVRLANGGTSGGNPDPRPLIVGIDGVTQTIENTNTGAWTEWGVRKVTLDLPESTDGDRTLTLATTASNGANIDAIAIVEGGQPFSFLPPTIESDAAFGVDENTLAIGAVVADDLDGDTLNYALSGVDADKVSIDASGNLTLNEAADFENPTDDGADGTYDVTVTVSDDQFSVSQDITIAVQDVLELPEPVIDQIVVQGEDGTINGTETFHRDRSDPTTGETTNADLDEFNLRVGYSGTGYTDFGGSDESVTWTFTVAETGFYDLTIRYASAVSATSPVRPLDLLVGGEAQYEALSFPGEGTTDSFANWVELTVRVALEAGSNDITLAIPDGFSNGPNIDALALTTVGADATFPPANSAPEFVAAPESTLVDENVVGPIGDFATTDLDDDAVTYSLTGDDADDFTIDAAGALSFAAAPDFENPTDSDGDSVYNVTVVASDGLEETETAFTVTVADVDEPASEITLTAVAVAENVAGATVATIVTDDPDSTPVAADFTLSDTVNFRLVDGAEGVELALAEGVSLDFEAASQPTVTVSLGAVSAEFTPAPTDEVEGNPGAVTFDESTLASYTGGQDYGPGTASVSEDGASLTLDGNLWKRSPLAGPYTITEDTVVTLEIKVGETVPEIVAFGFDVDEDPFDGDGTVYQLAGTQTQGSFIDLRGTGTPVGTDGTLSFTIDLSAHAGATIDSFVYISDDDFAGDGVGGATFANVVVEEVDPGNTAPHIVGPGLPDLTIDENSFFEIDLPFVDDEGDPISYTVSVVDGAGQPASGFEALTTDGDVLAGPITAAPSAQPYVVTVTASDGNGETSTSFEVTVVDVNDAPVVDDEVAFEPFFGEVGQPITSIPLQLFAGAFSDPDGDALTLSVEGLPGGLSVNEEGAIVGTPTGTGDGTFTVVATDTGGLQASIEVPLIIDGQEIGDVITVEAEDFTGLGDQDEFYVSGANTASGNAVIRTGNFVEASVSTDLAANGLLPGWYRVSLHVYDENDGTATFSFQIGDTVLATNETFDDNGVFDYPDGNRGIGGNLGNVKTITFDTPVQVTEDTIAIFSGTSDREQLRVDRLSFEVIEEPNLVPTDLALDTATVAENDAGAVIGTLSAVDPDGDDAAITFSVDAGSPFEVDGTTLKLKDGESLDFEAGATVSVDITATDERGATSTTTVEVTVSDVNDAPESSGEAIAPLTFRAGEAITGVPVSTFAGAFADDDGDALTLTVTNLPAGLTVDSGVIVGTPTTAGSGTFTVTATDPDGLSFSRDVTVDVIDDGGVVVIEAEDFTGLDTADGFQYRSVNTASNNGYIRLAPSADDGSVTTDLAAGGVAPGWYQVSIKLFDEQDGNSTISLMVGDTVIAENVSIDDNGTFEFTDVNRNNGTAAGNLKTITFDVPVEVAPGDLLTLSAVRDNGEDVRVDFVTFEAIDEPNAAPSAPALDTAAIDENDAGAVVGTLSSVDPDGTAVTFSIADATSDFEVDGTTLKLKDGVSLDHEANGTVDVVVTATDEDGRSTNATLTITVNDVDEAPELAPGASLDDLELAAGAGGSVDLSVLGASDPEGDPITYTVAEAGGGTLPAGFVIDGDQLTIAGGVPNGTYEVAVFASANGLDSESVEFTVTVSDTPAFGVVIEAETADITLAQPVDNSSTQVRDAANPETNGNRPDFSGTGYVDFGNDAGDTITVTADMAEAGNYDLNIRYATNTDRPLDLTINGMPVTQLPFTSTDPDGTGEEEGFDHWEFATITVALAQGENTISLAIPAGTNTGPNIDRFEITAEGTGPIPPADLSADEDGNLAAAPDVATVDPDDLGAVAFRLSGVDADIVAYEVSTDGGATFTPVTPVADGGDQVITLDLTAFAADDSASVVFRITDDAANQEERTAVIAIDDAFVPFTYELQLETRDGTVTILDDTGGGTNNANMTQVRDLENPESVTPERPDGLWTDYNGDGYLDMGMDVGDAFAFDVDVPADGQYTFTFRYANFGGDGLDRPMTFAVNGTTLETIPFSLTAAWDDWQDASVTVNLTAGVNTITLANTIATGPNLDQVTVEAVGAPEPPSEPGPRETILINFQDGTAPKAAGYLVANFDAYGDRGNGYTYGFVTEASAIDADGTTATPIGGGYPAIAINERSGTDTLPEDGSLPADQLAIDYGDYDPRLTGYAHFDLGSFPEPVAFELELENGWYEVTASLGDTGGPNDSSNAFYVEGELVSSWVPTSAYKSQLVTTVAHVEDGHLTLSAQGSTITEIQYLEVRELPDLTPDDGNDAPADYASFFDARAVSGVGTEEVVVDLDPGAGARPENVDPSSDIFLGINVVDGRGGALLESLNDGSIKLYETLTGEEVTVNVNTTGGFDSLTISPSGGLQEFTSYTLVIDGFRDRGEIADETSATREFQKFSTTFVTGEAAEVVDREVAFVDTLEVTSNANIGEQYSSIEISPDGQYLYTSSLTGFITRWELNADGSLDQSTKEVFAPGGDFETADGRRGFIGMTFDPEDPNKIWVSDNYPIPLNGRDNGVPDFSGRISTITLGENGSLENATIETFAHGFPRSNGDHLTNSLEFRAVDDGAGGTDYELYLIQGSNSAMGEPDSAWGFRPERLLNASVMKIDYKQTPPPGGWDVATEPLPTDGQNRRFADTDNDLKNGGILIDSGEYTGSYLHFDENGVASVREGADATSALIKEFYNPFAEGAVVQIFATGTRNAYDLVWHSNGFLYVPTNGSAAGGNTPDDPSTTINEGTNNVQLQSDYLFRIVEDGYYGHPNELRDQYILNHGYADNSKYAPTQGPDEEYDEDGVYSLGNNRSPNGAIEYLSDTFGNSLKNAVLFTEYSGGDDIRAVLMGPDGKPVEDFVLQRPDGSVIKYTDPLDVTQDADGRIYIVTLNRSNGVSQIIRLDPAPGGVVADTTADEGNDLALVVVDAEDPAAVLFQVNGLDDDIVTVTVDFGDGPQEVTLDAQNRFTSDLSAVTSEVTATLVVTDDDANTASDDVTFTPGVTPEPTDFFDGTDMTALNAETIIRVRFDPATADTGGNDLDGDGLNDGADGDSYVDFGGGAGDKASFVYTAAAAGTYTLTLRMANGSTDPRPIAVNTGDQSVTIADTNTGDFTAWETFDVTLHFEEGANVVILEQLAASGGPNVDSVLVTLDQLDSSVPNDGVITVGGIDYVAYEAENADLIGGAVIADDPRTQRGGEFVDFDGTTDQTIEWTVEVSEDGTYALDIIYALSTTKAARPMDLSIDGTLVGTLPFEPNSSVDEDVWGPQSTTVSLTAGVHTIAVTAPLANGPNVDYLRITQDPVDTFQPNYAAVDGETRIELEATDDTTRTVSDDTVEFYFTVADDGIYQLGLAANTGAADGGGVTLFLTADGGIPVEIDDNGFPGVGDAGETSAYTELAAGVEYKLTVVSDNPGADDLDYLDVSLAPGDPDADIGIQSLDPAFLDNRLHFSYLEDPTEADGSGNDRIFKDSGTVRISNTGTSPLEILESELSGPFTLENPAVLDGLTLAAGAFVDVVVNFDRSQYTPPTGSNSQIDGTSTIFEGALEITTNDADSPVVTVDLAGFWQRIPEGGNEPNVNEVWDIFGFGNFIEGLTLLQGGGNSALSTNDVFAQTDATEVLSPYWKIADGYTAATITQIAAFHGPGGATIGIHNPGNANQDIIFWNHQGDSNQMILPGLNNGNFASTTFTNGTVPDGWNGDDIFGFEVAGLSTDPRLNPTGDVIVPGEQQGHTVKIFQAVDGDGEVIDNVFLGIMDYTGINYDYNDNLLVIEGITPLGFGQNLELVGLDAAAADDRLVFSAIDNPVGGQVTRDTATFQIVNDGIADLTIEGLSIGGADAGVFEIVSGPADGTVVGAGQSVDVTVAYTGSDPVNDQAAVLHEAVLEIVSNDYDEGVKTISLAGLAQFESEGGEEPTVAQIVEAFGYSTDVAQGSLSNGGTVETVGDEVLLPYLQQLDGSQPVEVIQLAAYLSQGNVGRLNLHGLSSDSLTELFAADDNQGQTVLPDGLVSGGGDTGGVASATFNPGSPFGLKVTVDGRPTYAAWTDPVANTLDPAFSSINTGEGHYLRFFEALDGSGQVIEGTYIGIQDYPGGGNFDYNDMMFVIKNVEAYTPTGDDDLNGDGINDALQLDEDNDGTVNFFDDDFNPPSNQSPYPGPNAPTFTNGTLTVDASNLDNGGQGVSYNDNPGRDSDNGFRSDIDVEFVGAQNDIGHVLAGEWVEYTIDVPAAGTYALSVNAKTPIGGNTIAVSVEGGPTLTTFALADSNGGDTSFTGTTFGETASQNIVLEGGEQTLRFTFGGSPASNGYVLDFRAFTLEAVDAQSPYPGPDAPLLDGTLTVDALNYDEGGQGIAYNDGPGLAGGTDGGRTGSDVEVTSNGDIGWIDAGDWLEFTVDVAQAGAYDIDLLMSTNAGGRSLTVDAYSPTGSTPYASTGSIANPSTGSYTTFEERSGTIDLDEGEQVLRVTFDGGSQDFRSFTLTDADLLLI